MTRRVFIRWMVVLFALIAAALTGLFKLLQWAVQSRQTDAAAEPVVRQTAKQEQPAPPAAGDNEALSSFFILSDLHISVYDPNTTKHMKEALEDMKQFESPVDALILTGDLTDFGGEDGYKELRKLLSAYKLPPLYANMGNHDYYDIWIDKKGAFNKDTAPNGKTDWQSRERFQKFFNVDKVYNAVEVNGYQVILLSQEAYAQEKPEVGEGAWYSDEQLDWFKQQLAKNAGRKPVFVMTHQPLPPIGSDGRTHQLIPAKKFRDILKPYPNVFVFCGHRHQDFQSETEHYVKETFHYFHNSSVGRVLNRSFQNAGKDKAQGLYVQVYKDRVHVRGREFSNRTWLKEADWTIKLT